MKNEIDDSFFEENVDNLKFIHMSLRPLGDRTRGVCPYVMFPTQAKLESKFGLRREPGFANDARINISGLLSRFTWTFLPANLHYDECRIAVI